MIWFEYMDLLYKMVQSQWLEWADSHYKMSRSEWFVHKSDWSGSWLTDLVAVLLKGRLSVNNNVYFDLLLAQNFQMALEDLKCSSRVIWTTLIVFFMMLSCTFLNLKARTFSNFLFSLFFSLTYIRQLQIHMPKLQRAHWHLESIPAFKYLVSKQHEPKYICIHWVYCKGLHLRSIILPFVLLLFSNWH